MNNTLSPLPQSPEGGEALAPKPSPLAALRARLPRFEDEKQKRAGGNILRFLAALVVLTLVARGTAGATMASVTTSRLSGGEILQQISATGRVQAAGSTTLEAPDGLTVEQMLTAAGERLAAGDPVARFKLDDVRDRLAREQNALKDLQQQLAALTSGSAYDSTSLANAQNSLTWAEQDYNTAKANGEAAVARAESNLAAAREELAAAQNALASLPEDADEAERAAAQLRVDTAGADIPLKEQAVNEARTALNEALTQAQRSLENAKNSLSSAQISDSEARKNAAEAAAANGIQAEAKRLDIQRQQELVDSLTQLLENEGVLYTPIGGTVVSAAQNGFATASGPLLEIENTADGYIAEATITSAEAKDLVAGTEVEVETSSNTYSSTTAKGTLLSVSDADAAGNVTLRVRLPESSWKSGDSVPLRIVQSRQSYSQVVPLSALHTDNQSYYLLVVDTSTGVLGEVNTLRAVPVTLAAKNDSYAAIESVAIGYDEEIVTGSSKSVAAGDRVRLG